MLRLALLFGLLSLHGLVHARANPTTRGFPGRGCARSRQRPAGRRYEHRDTGQTARPRRATDQRGTERRAEKASAFGSIKVSSGGQNTYPVTARTIRSTPARPRRNPVESHDFKAAGELISSCNLRCIEWPEFCPCAGHTCTQRGCAHRRRDQDLPAARRCDPRCNGRPHYKVVRFSINGGSPPQYPGR